MVNNNELWLGLLNHQAEVSVDWFKCQTFLVKNPLL